MAQHVSKGRIHVIIGDTQVKDGVPTEHLSWVGRYIVDQFAGQDVTLVHVGDHADMPSLSGYDKGKKAMEGRRYKTDIRSANKGFDLLNVPLQKYNLQRRKLRKAQWLPRKIITLGNHEDRISRAINDDAQLEGVISLDDLNYAEWGWEVIPYKKIEWVDGIAYSHFFYHPKSGKPYGGDNLKTRLKTIGHSFVMGHQQGMDWASREVGNTRQLGIVNGSCYLHDEDYLGPQVTNYWRGIVVLHQVENGWGDPMMVSLDFLCRKYARQTLADFMRSRVK